MPKKRHWARYSKPQSTAPTSLESSGLQSNLHYEEPHARNVNDLLANMRRASLGIGGTSAATTGALPALGIPTIVSPSVPPELAPLLQPGLLAVTGPGLGTPGTGAPEGAGGAGRGAMGRARRRRAPAGPAPPPSWLGESQDALWATLLPQPTSRGSGTNRNGQSSSTQTAEEAHRSISGLDMPSLIVPARGSLVDMVLRRIVLDWNTTWSPAVRGGTDPWGLCYLPGALKAALISYLSSTVEKGGCGVVADDLRALLLLPDVNDDKGDDNDDDDAEYMPPPSPSTLNEDLRYLDLSGSVGTSISVKEVNDLLFPPTPSSARSTGIGGPLPETWDSPAHLSLSRALLPNLTHISLALADGGAGADGDGDDMASFDHVHGRRCLGNTAQRASWRHLLALARHLPRLTHLRLTRWPEPTLTPNAKFATVATPQGRRVPFGGTGPYSHTVDSDWAEAVLLVRRLSKALCGLEYLDLTACTAWAVPALMQAVDGAAPVDWVGDWGKVTTIVLRPAGTEGNADAEVGQEGRLTEELPGSVARRVNAASEARLLERHIRTQRAGRGRLITVESDGMSRL